MTDPLVPSLAPSAAERALDRALDALARFVTLLSGCCLVVLIAIFGWLVFGRYVLNATPTWAEQLALLLIVFITFLSAAVGVHEQRHLSVDFLRDALPRGARRTLLVVGDLVMAGFGVLMALHAWHLVVFKWSFAGSRALRRALGRYPWQDDHLLAALEPVPLVAPTFEAPTPAPPAPEAPAPEAPAPGGRR
jgi:TRAP-type C4-dicarboxylate transport system permease small subunit